jgi:hypothetical protein
LSQESACLEGLKEGQEIRLKDGALPHVKIREWEFQCLEKGMILLKKSSKGYILEVTSGDIDWEEFRRKKSP